MSLFSDFTFKISHPVRSLCWRGEDLIDWVGGGRWFAPDGAEHSASVRYAYRFDAAISSPDGQHAVIYEKLGTKGLLLRNGEIIREIGRSFYCADAYEYPLTLLVAADGRLILAHCPNDYCCIEFEDVESGTILTHSTERSPRDFFHSRLSANRRGSRLLSAGWQWHPFDSVVYFDVQAAIENPQLLDKGNSFPLMEVEDAPCEEKSACWLNENSIAIATSADEYELGEGRSGPLPSLHGLSIFDLSRDEPLRTFDYDHPLGTIIAIGEDHILSLYRHPKLIELATGNVVHEWTELQSGLQQSSIALGLAAEDLAPPHAYDPENRRFAIANGDMITVITLTSSNLSFPRTRK